MKKLSLLTFVLMFVMSLSSAFADRLAFVVPVRTVYPGQTITDIGLSEKHFFIKNEAAPLYVTSLNQVMNKVAKRTLIAGRPISLSAVGEPVLVNRGEAARLVFSAGDLMITALGIPLEPGSVGDYVRVRNADSGRVVSGTVMKDGSIQVGVQ